MAILVAWEEHLKANLKLPCKARYVEDDSHLIEQNEEIIIQKIDDLDDTYGILCRIKGYRGNIFPMCDFVPLELNETNQALQDYVDWFANK